MNYHEVFVLQPGVGVVDGVRRKVGAGELRALYRVPRRKRCIVLCRGFSDELPPGTVVLRPREDGDYRLDAAHAETGCDQSH